MFNKKNFTYFYTILNKKQILSLIVADYALKSEGENL